MGRIKGAVEFTGALMMRARDLGFTAVQVLTGERGQPTRLFCGYAGEEHAALVLEIDEARFGADVALPERRRYFAELLAELGRCDAASLDKQGEAVVWLSGESLETVAAKFLRAEAIAKKAEELRKMLLAAMLMRGRLAIDVRDLGAVMVQPSYQRPDLDRAKTLEQLQTLRARLVEAGVETEEISALPTRQTTVAPSLRVTLA
jgi:hypothetical protein